MSETRKNRLAAFLADYRAICERHNITVCYDGGYLSHEVADLDWAETYYGGVDWTPEVWHFANEW